MLLSCHIFIPLSYNNASRYCAFLIWPTFYREVVPPSSSTTTTTIPVPAAAFNEGHDARQLAGVQSCHEFHLFRPRRVSQHLRTSSIPPTHTLLTTLVVRCFYEVSISRVRLRLQLAGNHKLSMDFGRQGKRGTRTLSADRSTSTMALRTSTLHGSKAGASTCCDMLSHGRLLNTMGRKSSCHHPQTLIHLVTADNMIMSLWITP